MPLCIFLHFCPQKRLNCKRFKKILVPFPRNRFLPNQSTQLKIIFFAPYKQNSFLLDRSQSKTPCLSKTANSPTFFDGTHILFAKQPFALFYQKAFEFTGKLSFVKHSVVFRAKKERILCMRSYFVQLCFSAVNFYVHRLSVDCDGEIFVDGIQLTVYFCRFFVLSVLFLLRFQLLLHYRKH